MYCTSYFPPRQHVFRYFLGVVIFVNPASYRDGLQFAPNITKCVLPFPFFSSEKFESINFRNSKKFQIHLFFKKYSRKSVSEFKITFQLLCCGGYIQSISIFNVFQYFFWKRFIMQKSFLQKSFSDQNSWKISLILFFLKLRTSGGTVTKVQFSTSVFRKLWRQRPNNWFPKYLSLIAIENWDTSCHLQLTNGGEWRYIFGGLGCVELLYG